MTARQYNKKVLKAVLPHVQKPDPFLCPPEFGTPEVSIYAVFDALRALSGETEEEFNKFLDDLEKEKNNGSI